VRLGEVLKRFTPSQKRGILNYSIISAAGFIMVQVAKQPEIGPEQEAFAKALEAERLRNGRRLNGIRFAGTLLFLLLLILLQSVGKRGAEQHVPDFLIVYSILGAVLFVGGYISDRLTGLSILAIPFVDIPLVFLVQYEGLAMTRDPRAVVNFTLAVYVCLLMLATMALRRRQLYLAGALAMVLQLILDHRGKETPTGVFGGILLFGLTVAVCDYARLQRVQMIRRFCTEQLWREKLWRYFSPAVARRIQEQTAGLEDAQSREVTVLFCDLRGFTRLGEKLSSTALVTLLNDFHSRMVESVFACGGTLDKYMGDGLMAYFGAPLPQADHARQAVLCALAMQDRLDHLNGERQRKGEPALRMGIGIHTGPAVIGSIGAPHRREFTAIGDTVNLASRLEQLTKAFGEAILVSEETRQQLGEGLVCRPLRAVRIRGKADRVKIFAPAPLVLPHLDRQEPVAYNPPESITC
jgi:adenylate cyclase